MAPFSGTFLLLSSPSSSPSFDFTDFYLRLALATRTGLATALATWTMKSPLANKRRSVEVCVKCRKCGLPWNRKLQRKRRRQRNKQSSPPVIHCILSVIAIQAAVRRYLIKRHQKNNDPIELWNRKCVHYLSAKGPYAARSHFDPYQRLAVYTSAATAIQNAWHLHRWLKHLRLLSSVTKEMNAIIIQRSWRSSWCRRSFGVVYNAMKIRERVFYSTIIGSAADATHRFCLSGCPFAIKYKQHGSNVWVQVDCNKFRSYVQQQLQLERKRRRRNSNRRRTTNLTPTKSATEIKRDKIRRMSQKKWKWFYDKKDCCEDSAQPSSKVTVDTTQSSDDESDVMTWLTNLDLDSCVDS